MSSITFPPQEIKPSVVQNWQESNPANNALTALFSQTLPSISSPNHSQKQTPKLRPLNSDHTKIPNFVLSPNFPPTARVCKLSVTFEGHNNIFLDFTL